MKRILTLLLGALLAPALLAAQDRRVISQTLGYDADSTSRVYCHSIGRAGSMSGGSARGADYGPSPLRVSPSGSDTSIASETASSGALTQIVAGDIFAVVIGGKRQEFLVTDKTDNDSIELDRAVDLSDGARYFYR